MRRSRITKQSGRSRSQRAAFPQRKNIHISGGIKGASLPKQLTRVQTFRVLQSAEMSTLGYVVINLSQSSAEREIVLPISGLFSPSALTTAAAGGVRFSGCPFIHFLWTQYLRDTVGATSSNSAPKINSVDVGGQRSEGEVTVTR